jgi:hypothetical protein
MLTGIMSSTVVSSNGFMDTAAAPQESNEAGRYTSVVVGAMFALGGLLIDKARWRDALASYACGVIFMVGLAVSGMTQRSKVLQFLNISPAWDPSLIFVMGVGVALLVPVFWMVQKRAKSNPILDTKGLCTQHEDCYVYQIPINKTIDSPLIVGAIIFGIGWGLGGLCPGPAVGLLALGYPKVALAFFPSLFVGMSMAMGLSGVLKQRRSRAEDIALAEDKPSRFESSLLSTRHITINNSAQATGETGTPGNNEGQLIDRQ